MAKMLESNNVNSVKSKVEFRNSWAVPTIFLVFTLLFLSAFVYMMVLQGERNRYYEEVEAEVVSVADYTDKAGKDHYEVYLRYVVDGEKYRQKLTYWDEDLKIGDTTTIQYDSRNPLIIKTSNTYTYLIVIEVVMSLLLSSITAFLFIRKLRFCRQRAKENNVQQEKFQEVSTTTEAD